MCPVHLTLSVITLPVLAPIAALLQLLFPGLLRDQWKQYRVAISVLLTQSTVFMIHWALVTFWITDRVWWLSDAALTFAIVVVAIVGLFIALFLSRMRVAKVRRRLDAYHATRQQTRSNLPAPATATTTAAAPVPSAIYIPPVPSIHPLVVSPVDRSPVKVEYAALGIFAGMGVCWAIYQSMNGVSPLDQVASVTAACLIGLAHLLFRRARMSRPVDGTSIGSAHATSSSPMIASTGRPLFATTEIAFLFSLVLAGSGLGLYFNQADADNINVNRVVTDWPTYRGNKHRTGVIDGTNAPLKPQLLWSFDPGERKGRVMFHSTPTVVEGRIYIGALHEIQTFAQGYLYCINASDRTKATDVGTPAAGQPNATLEPGTQIWKFTGTNWPGGSAKPIFCSPTVHGGIVYFGEGYHEDTGCRMFAIDTGTQQPQWSVRTTSHTESPPTIVANRIYFGAGDDGVFCFDMKQLSRAAVSSDDTLPSPKLLWQSKGLHIDAAPCIADGRVFVGAVVGDIHAKLAIVALDADTGDELWRRDAPLPVPGSASHASGRIYIGLGSGKLDHDSPNPAGAVWCLDAATGNLLWEFKTSRGVFNSPVIANGRCYFTSRDQHLYCLDEVTGNVHWKRDIGQPMVCAPVVTEDDVIITTLSGMVKCIRTADGSERWSFEHPDMMTKDNDVYASPTLSGGRIYVAAKGKVHCIGDKLEKVITPP